MRPGSCCRTFGARGEVLAGVDFFFDLGKDDLTDDLGGDGMGVMVSRSLFALGSLSDSVLRFGMTRVFARPNNLLPA
jgi:hypothetical protein